MALPGKRTRMKPFTPLVNWRTAAVGTIEANKLATGENDGLKIELYGEYGALKFDLMDLNYLYYYDNSHPGHHG